MTTSLFRTSLLAPIPEAEPVVGGHRERLDHTAGWGVPAHVTVLYPFVPPDQVTLDVLDRLGLLFATVPAFECVLDRVAWFAEEVVWLAPADDRPFRALTQSVVREFPDHPPYRGAIPDPTPHLTVGDTHLADLETMRRAAIEIEPRLPVTAQVERTVLMAGTDEPGSWQVMAGFPLA